MGWDFTSWFTESQLLAVSSHGSKGALWNLLALITFMGLHPHDLITFDWALGFNLRIWKKSESERCSVISDSHRLYSPWNSPGQNTGVGSLSRFQGIFPIQGLNLGLLHCRQILYQLSHKGSPKTLKNWCFCTVVLEKTLKGPLDCKEIKPLYPKGNQPSTFIGRTDAEAETPILWPLDAKNWLMWKDPVAGKDWLRLQEEKAAPKDKMVG